MKKKVFYLGPQASYCDYAKNKFVSTFFLEEYEQVAKHSILSTIKELTKETNQDSYAVIPIENSVEGIVRETIDNLGLLTNTSIKIIAETSIPIQHCLASYANNLEEIKVISSHPLKLFTNSLYDCIYLLIASWERGFGVLEFTTS